jgi:hypothetical protein
MDGKGSGTSHSLRRRLPIAIRAAPSSDGGEGWNR